MAPDPFAPPDAELVLAELATLLERICQHEQSELSADTRIEDIPGIDSLRLLQAVAQLEESFRLEVDVAALEDLDRVRDIVNAIRGGRPMG